MKMLFQGNITAKTAKLLPFFTFIFMFHISFAQNSQIVRGKITDAASKSPMIGATVVVMGSNPLLGTVTDENGSFRLAGVAIGRINLKVTLIGYEDLFAKDIIVNTGKEVVLDLAMTESLTSLNEVTVTYSRQEDATITNNEMTTLSARPFNPTETLKYAGSLGDPSRMAANFAGVSGANDSRNDIVVRGNSPSTLLWRLDGVNIPNPNHFGALGTSGGPVSMLNANLLAKSDFMSGAFPAEYANALGSVFDLRLRKGNDEKREFLAQMAFNGVELGAEGYYTKKSKASYLLNYRYSVFGLMSAIGFKIAGTPYYQDLTFKTDIPVGKRGNLSFWTIGGISNISLLGKDVDTSGDAYGEENTNTKVDYMTGMAALAYEHRLTDKTYGKITFSASRANSLFSGDTVIYKNGTDAKPEVLQEINTQASDFTTEKLSVNLSLNHKFNAKNKVSGGVILDFNRFNLLEQRKYPFQRNFRNTVGETMLAQGYLQWKHRFSQKLTLNAGLNSFYYELNKQATVEPRLGLSYNLSEKSNLNVAYGLHSNVQPILLSFLATPNANGQMELTNKNLGFNRSHHFVVGYDRSLSENLRLKVEAYYQALFDIPIERQSSYYSVLTEGADFAPISKSNLVNTGSGKNMGVEMTLEKYFANSYYFLVTASLFDSKYTGSDGVERNSPFNTRYVLNALAGKEFKIGRNGNILSLNFKTSTAGGRYILLVDTEKSAQTGTTVYSEKDAYTQQQSAYFRTDLKISYKINRKKLTHEIAIDLQNITNHQNIFQQSFNPRTGKVNTTYQQGFLPIPFYRLTF
jgi:hypothetical protein